MADIDFRIGGDRTFYALAHDYVQVPPPQAYFEPINWHRTGCTNWAMRPVPRIDSTRPFRFVWLQEILV